MPCKACGSRERREFPSEVYIHPPRDWKELASSGVLAFPLLLVCENCGFTELSLDDDVLRSLHETYAVNARKTLKSALEPDSAIQ